MRINIYSIQKIPVNFNIEDPHQKNKGYIEAFGNYDCYLYQYAFYQDIAVVHLSKEQEYYNIPKDEQIELCLEENFTLDKDRNKLNLRKLTKNTTNVATQQFCERLYIINHTISKFISFNEFFLLATQTYTKELAPYAQGVERKTAEALVKKLIQSFLNSETDKCIYIEFPPVWSRLPESHIQVKPVSHTIEPYIINNRFGILDPVNKEFFELILGGTD